MDFYDDPNNVNTYMSMAEGYDGRFLVEKLKEHLKEGSIVLELGMGPGKDQVILRECYEAIGSDRSQVFLDLFKSEHGDKGLLLLDAISIETVLMFDGIYSNKVLQHLTEKDLEKSIQRQYELVNEGGILLHSFWLGDGEENYDGLRFVYYTEAPLIKAFEKKFEILELKRYTEDEDNDSIYIIVKKVI